MAGQRSLIPSILVLGEVPPGLGATVGGKAAQLADLARAGFPVLPGIVVTAGVVRATAEQLLAAIDTLATRGVTFAMRSSGVAEDGAEASFAGQYFSLLNVSRLGVPAAVEQVRSSGASERVAAYGGTPAVIPVLVQPMVSAIAAGVAFTADPVTGNRATTIVTAVRGLGDQLVGGEVNGEEWVVRQGAPRRVASAMASWKWRWRARSPHSRAAWPIVTAAHRTSNGRSTANGFTCCRPGR
jgi:phosphoenolpyruvate synthase/pyruvate phosphate dikinase